MPRSFEQFFTGRARDFLLRALDAALDEDGPDPASEGIFPPEVRMRARLVAKEPTLAVGLPVMDLVCQRLGAPVGSVTLLVPEASRVEPGTVVLTAHGPAALLLRAERVALNAISHASGVANLTATYVAALGDSPTRLLDTRKTLPGLRSLEKYAVQAAGGHNHRSTLAELLMLKDNHVDRAGSVTEAVRRLREALPDTTAPIEVECRTLSEVREAVAAGVRRIMLDNMGPDVLQDALALIPEGMESEVSGGVTLQTIAAIGALGPDYVSVGALTHSAPAADFSLQVESYEDSR